MTRSRKKHYAMAFILSLSLVSFSAAGQVTIGSGIEPRKGALLELKENNKTGKEPNSTKGFGLPRVSLESPDKLTIDEDDKKDEYTGICVYNTKVINESDKSLVEGIYFWDGEKWCLQLSEKDRTEIHYIYGKPSGQGLKIPFINTTIYKYTGYSITLPPGLWRVDVSMTMSYRGAATSSSLWLRTSFSDTNNTTGNNKLSPDLYPKPGIQKISGAIYGPFKENGIKYAILQGSLFINNRSKKNKTYYYIAGNQYVMNGNGNQLTYLDRFAGEYWGENYIIASPANPLNF